MSDASCPHSWMGACWECRSERLPIEYRNDLDFYDCMRCGRSANHARKTYADCWSPVPPPRRDQARRMSELEELWYEKYVQQSATPRFTVVGEQRRYELLQKSTEQNDQIWLPGFTFHVGLGALVTLLLGVTTNGPFHQFLIFIMLLVTWISLLQPRQKDEDEN